jgi:hypothetical protein
MFTTENSQRNVYIEMFTTENSHQNVSKARRADILLGMGANPCQNKKRKRLGGIFA